MKDELPETPAPGRAGALFWWVFACATALRLLLAWRLDPCDDEAYYFYWSLFPQLSYFDHPPLVAWAMAAVGPLFGDSIWTVRFWPLVGGSAVALFGRALGRRLFNREAGDLAGIFLLLAPALAGNGVLMTPDTLFGAAWAAALYGTWRALAPAPRRWLWWAFTGLTVGVGLLSKYNMILYFGGLGLLWLLSPGRRREILLGGCLAGAVALAVFSPVLIWNGQHDWVSFRFQLGHGFGGKGRASALRTFPEYLGSLLLIVSPGLALLAFWTGWKGLKAGPFERRFLSSFFWVFVVFFGVSALRARVQPNWPMLAFFPGLVLVAAAWREYPRVVRRIALGLLACMLAGAVLGLGYLAAPRAFVVRLGGKPVGFTRMQEFVGGRDVAEAVALKKAQSGLTLLCVTRHQLFGKIAYFAPDERAGMFMPPGRKPRFPWIAPGPLEGRDALIVAPSQNALNDVTVFFDSVEPLGVTRLRAKEAEAVELHFARGIAYRPGRTAP